jgi:DNA transformation protein
MPGGFQEHLEDLFAPLGGVTFRRMFGGLGIFRDAVMFAMVADDVLYLKIDAENEGSFEAEGCDPFVYSARGKETTMSYRRLPERLYDEPDEFEKWAVAAFDAALRAKKPGRKKKKTVGRG